ncbi:MAG: M23 family metallopeptidase [Frankiaceae bacterium]|nr:M23 family metallopeptidase [Frankiaceae bacterium]
MLLLSVGAALGGLAVLPGNAPASVSLTAASASSPMVIAGQQQIVSNTRDMSLLDGPSATPTRAPVRASRTRRIVAPPVPDYVRPGVGRLTSSFKWRWGRMHTGIDIAGPYGSPIRAVAAGNVIEAGSEGGYGYLVKIEHDNGVVTYYAHMSKILVDGGRVTAGQVIGKEGSTGHSTGPHLHFEVRINGAPINPIPWLAKHGIFF